MVLQDLIPCCPNDLKGVTIRIVGAEDISTLTLLKCYFNGALENDIRACEEFFSNLDKNEIPLISLQPTLGGTAYKMIPSTVNI